jgi:hypothetical protein
MEAHRLLSLIGDLGLDDEEVDVALRTRLPTSVRTKEDHLRVGSSSGQAASRLGNSLLIDLLHRKDRTRRHEIFCLQP